MENWKTQLSNPTNISEIVLLSAIFYFHSRRFSLFIPAWIFVYYYSHSANIYNNAETADRGMNFEC